MCNTNNDTFWLLENPKVSGLYLTRLGKWITDVHNPYLLKFPEEGSAKTMSECLEVFTPSKVKTIATEHMIC